MYITVSSNLLIALLLAFTLTKLLENFMEYRKVKITFREYNYYPFPSVAQVRRKEKLKVYRNNCFIFLISSLISIALLFFINY